MTVKKLIKKLSQMPEDAEVLFVNTDMFFNGAYPVDTVEDWNDGTILLDSEYKKNYWEDEEQEE